jgi:hypothetical protein
MFSAMRTTLDIDEDVLAAVRSLATQRRDSIGKVISDLARQTLMKRAKVVSRSGVPLIPVKKDAQPVTMEMVNELRDGDREG